MGASSKLWVWCGCAGLGVDEVVQCGGLDWLDIAGDYE